MADPVPVNCPAGEWTLVASNVVTGRIWRTSTAAKYLHTYRDTGGDPPTDQSEGAPIFVSVDPDTETISAANPIDVYIFAIGANGSVRVDL